MHDTRVLEVLDALEKKRFRKVFRWHNLICTCVDCLQADAAAYLTETYSKNARIDWAGLRHE